MENRDRFIYKHIISLGFLLLVMSTSYGQKKATTFADLHGKFILMNDFALLKEGRDYTIKKGAFGFLKYIDKSGEKIDLYNARYFANNEGFFAVQPSKAVIGTFEKIYRRSKAGAINLFYSVDKSLTSSVSASGQFRWHSNSSLTYYYAMELDNLKKLNIENLETDMVFKEGVGYQKKNKIIKGFLEKGKRKKRRFKTQLISGLSVFLVGGILYEASSSDNKGLKIGGLLLGFGGIVSAGTSLMIKPQKYYLKAVDEYNKYY